jgi:hypothetical protein
MHFKWLTIVLSIAAAVNAHAQTASQRGAISRNRQGPSDETLAIRKWFNDWGETRKLSVIRLEQDLKPRAVDQCINLSKAEENAVGFLDCYIFRVFYIENEKRVLLWPESTAEDLVITDGAAIMLDNFPTEKLADGDLCALIGPIRVKGIDTWGSGRKARKFEFVSIEELEKIRRENLDALEAKKKAAEDALYMTLKSKAGTEVVAKFIAFKNNKVELLTKDGRTLKLGFEVFADESATELRKLVREYRAKK